MKKPRWVSLGPRPDQTDSHVYAEGEANLHDVEDNGSCPCSPTRVSAGPQKIGVVWVHRRLSA